MKEKLKELIQNHKRILTMISRILILAIIISEGIYIKYQHDIIFKMSNTSKEIMSTQTTQTTENKQKETQSSSSTENKEIKLGEPVSVSTTSGDYKFTIEKAVKTEEFNKWDKEVEENNQLAIELFLECENIDFHNDKSKGVVMYDAFNVKDNNNYNLQHYSRKLPNYSDGYEPVLPNSKSKICIIYVGNKDSTSITVTFVRGGSVTIPLT